ncbi:CBS domain-containing protein [Parvicella tangerina]|uniref:CBS domain-containing protein n=1 Tax=Parvicella tangerina TaxID=2829795 RepID=A0A916NRT8_9FLAO|nr:CBS domain-containing protein [Parvicella tangerina]CAG5082105.1 hypothetical protein CRYO30217_01809 [Parvicella tangerina]
MQAKEIMSTPVVITKGNVKLDRVKDLFHRHQINSAPVLTEEGEIEGIITSSDLTAIHNQNLLVRDVMSRKVSVCALTARVQDLGKTMVNDGIHHIVVMDDGKVQGMVSSLDVIKGMLN